MDERLLKTKLVPVVVFKTTAEIKPTLDALKAGGIEVAEICFRTACAEEALIKAIKDYPEMLIGAGTVINTDQAKKAINAGAKFIVSPGLSVEVAKYCKEKNVTYLPGVVTPAEIMTALDLGLTYLKFFPAGVFGGLKAIKALSAAFPQVKFMPTGGVDNSNLKEFISEKSIFAVGGSWLLKGDIKTNCQVAVKIVKGE
ncbi:MAG: bifunctional 4-hydroxy-2-oxoglutarate aldolase/2-dehydro-3-deoxy-phosphogluconate aldolase [Bacilli bacterium]|nr:bifunctional 4-hydroxy-2-oxoglutarate aldolase/2-dehydro-3-deoxy-phosphogluconate aldolase [Bacilli bacterium]